MKKLLSTLALVSALGLGVFGLANVSYADDTKAVATATEAAPAADAAAPAATPATDEAAPAAAAPVADKGDIAWMIVATVLVTLMVIPGLGLFYGGLVRSKNMLSVLMQTFVIFSLIGVLWALYGYSVAFTDGNAFLVACLKRSYKVSHQIQLLVPLVRVL